MQKRIKIVIISIVFVIILIGIIVMNNNSNNKYSFTQDGIRYALTLDGEKATSFPSKGMYKVQVTCEGADGNWLYDEWKLAIENITGDISCDINFSTITKTGLNDYIISLAGSTQGTGQVVNENGYRYEGKNPNNYIWFNNEYWRIIGVFDSASHGVSGKNLVKIIRDETMGGISWNVSSSGNWANVNLNKLFNDAYYNATDGTSSGYCYGYGATATSNCDYTKKGIQSEYRNMIVNAIWYLGDYSNASANAEAFYKYERKSTTTTGYIGLMYPSDYGYSVLSSSCVRTTNLSSYNSATCAGQSWLYGKGNEWTLTPVSSIATVFYLRNDGGLYYAQNAYGGYNSRPVLYLDSSVFLYDGDGSLENPYIIGM